tara:strand:- start:1309 stop:1896 length:588 start_codon:yes stop_codon:yes gene_type:complete
MKKLNSTIIFLSLAISFFSLMAFTTYRTKIVPLVQLKSQPITEIPVQIPTSKLKIDLTSHQQFLNAIGHRESSNNYTVVNRFGYMGKYQFGNSTLKTLKINVQRIEFINNPELQEYAMHQNLLYNKKHLKRYIKKYDGTIVNGILITESGLLAAAHLGGAGSVKKWFRTGKVRKDGNGVKITSYMKRFSGYDLYL